ncbi:MAG: desulfoferrodoxin [Candidatus Margulisbacteria bacterium]|jgi:superoxide reductase|nr:desulfoferrodoxin [Candidatus Margulisiibacteriota bacterium]
MIEKHKIYKCAHCGAVVEALTSGGGILNCCGEPMAELKANTTDAAREKHLPVLEITADGDLVKVGSVAHPMEEKHFIEWIAVKTADGKIGRRFLKPGDPPQALFKIAATQLIESSAYCNLHGLWSSRLK